jgi:hypothetical protein
MHYNYLTGIEPEHKTKFTLLAIGLLCVGFLVGLATYHLFSASSSITPSSSVTRVQTGSGTEASTAEASAQPSASPDKPSSTNPTSSSSSPIIATKNAHAAGTTQSPALQPAVQPLPVGGRGGGDAGDTSGNNNADSGASCLCQTLHPVVSSAENSAPLNVVDQPPVPQVTVP